MKRARYIVTEILRLKRLKCLKRYIQNNSLGRQNCKQSQPFDACIVSNPLHHEVPIHYCLKTATPLTFYLEIFSYLVVLYNYIATIA